MKKLLHWQYLLLAILSLPATVMAQNYNYVHGFDTPYERSAHTCAVQITNGNIIEGGTIHNPDSATIRKTVELGIVNSATGLITPHPLYYTIPGRDHMAADLIESSINPNEVVVATNILDTATGLNRIGAFRADPATGAVAWALNFGPQYYPLYASAITRDTSGNYFIFGHIYTIGGTYDLYLASVTDAGVVNWIRRYSTPPADDDMRSVDLLYDSVNNVVILTANYSAPGGPNGIIIAQVNPVNGFLMLARNVLTVGNYPNIFVRDIDMMNGSYVMVGEVGSSPAQAFLVQYVAGFGFAPTGQVYAAAGLAIGMTGVKPSTTTDIYVSLDVRSTVFGVNPGIAQLNAAGVPLTARHYNVTGYRQSNGLVGVNSFANYAVKGNTDATAASGIPSLSMVGASTPLLPPTAVCPDSMVLSYFGNPIEIPMEFQMHGPQDYNEFNIIVDSTKGSTYDCFGMLVANFRLAPTGIENTEATLDLSIYPNPSDGIMTLQLTDETVDRYETAEIFNTLGTVVASFNVTNTVEEINLSDQAPGIYLLRMKSRDGKVSEAKRLLIK